MSAVIDGMAHVSLVALYTNGWCPIFACALKSLDQDRFALVETEEDRWHVACEDRDGFIWDVEGRHGRGDFEAEWGEVFPLIVLGDEMERMVGEGDWEHLSYYLTTECFGAIPASAWSITVGLAAEVLDGSLRVGCALGSARNGVSAHDPARSGDGGQRV